ncbi:hypothetical protein [Lactiplantibacillus plantarum]|uniref:hypothetical protein n=1 Tax=Lactiplantibacillus plantarum TaxID=1590 RepID=UPI003F5392BD
MKKDENGVSGIQSLSFRVSGDEMDTESGYDLSTVIGSLNDIESLVNKTYLSLNNRQRFNDQDAQRLNVRLKKLEKGSLWTQLDIVYHNVVIPALPYLAANQDFILATIKDSLKYIRAKRTAEKKGQTPMIEQKAGAQSVVVNATGNAKVRIIVPRGLPKVADELQPEFKKLSEHIDGKGVSSIGIGSNLSPDVSEELKLDENDKELLSTKEITSDEQFSIVGKIFSGNFSANNGKILVIQTGESSLEIGKVYRAEISKELHAEDKWKDMFLTARPYYCKLKLKSDSNGFKVDRLVITDWENENWDDYLEVAE